MSDMQILLDAYQVMGRMKFTKDMPNQRALALVMAYDNLRKFIMPDDYPSNNSVKLACDKTDSIK